MNDELLRPKEACRFLDLSLSTLYRYTKEGQITFIKAGAYIRYRKSDLIAFLDKHTIKGES